jgi:hypothetical protein
MDLSDRRSQTSPVLGAARTVTDWCRLLHTRPSPLAGRWVTRRAATDQRSMIRRHACPSNYIEPQTSSPSAGDSRPRSRIRTFVLMILSTTHEQYDARAQRSASSRIIGLAFGGSDEIEHRRGQEVDEVRF